MMPDFTPSVYFFSYLGTGSTFITGKINRTGQFVGISDELNKIGRNIGRNCHGITYNYLFVLCYKHKKYRHYSRKHTQRRGLAIYAKAYLLSE